MVQENDIRDVMISKMSYAVELSDTSQERIKSYLLNLSELELKTVEVQEICDCIEISITQNLSLFINKDNFISISIYENLCDYSYAVVMQSISIIGQILKGFIVNKLIAFVPNEFKDKYSHVLLENNFKIKNSPINKKDSVFEICPISSGLF